MSARDFDPADEVARLRRPPHDLEAEQSLLGAMLHDNAAYDRVADLVIEESFYRHEHRLVFAAIGSLVSANKPADPVTVWSMLQGGEIDDLGLQYLEALVLSVPSARNARRYAEIVADRAARRAVIAAADEIAAKAFQVTGASAELVDEAVTKLLKLESQHARTSSIVGLDTIIAQRLDRLDDLAQRGAESEGAAWPTPFEPLNRALSGGVRPGQVVVVAARPSIGKSALAQALGVRFATRGLPVLFLSQEMTAGELGDRILAQMGGISLGHLHRATLDDAEWSALSDAAHRASRLPFHVDEQPALTIGQIRAKARSVRDLRVLIVDYLQLTASAPTHRGSTNRNAEIEEVSRGLKSLAKELGIVVVLLSQLNREVEKRSDKKPGLADLRDSGAIEQDADVVLLMWPLKPGQPAGSEGVPVGMHVAKNRSGERDVEFPMLFDGRLMQWNESHLPMTAYAAGRATGGDL